jgi:membrane-associated phospholipid phosphatase
VVVSTASTAAAEAGLTRRDRRAAISFCALLLLAVVWPAPIVFLNSITLRRELSIDFRSFLGREAPVWDVAFWSIAGLWLIQLFRGRVDAAVEGFRSVASESAVALRTAPRLLRRYARRAALATIVASFLVVSLVFFADLPATSSAANLTNRTVAVVVVLLNRLGGGLNPLMIAGFFVFAGAAGRRLPWIRAGVAMLAAGLVSGILVHSLKWIGARIRPELWTSVLDSSPAATGSFPSGHTASAFAIATVIFASSRSLWLRYSAVVLAIAIAAARIIAFRHWLSDVVAAAMIGIGFSVLFLAAQRAGGRDLE